MTKKKPVTISVDHDLVYSWIEGGLWGMRLIEQGESVIGVTEGKDGKLLVELRDTGKYENSKQLSLAFLGKDNP